MADTWEEFLLRMLTKQQCWLLRTLSLKAALLETVMTLYKSQSLTVSFSASRWPNTKAHFTERSYKAGGWSWGVVEVLVIYCPKLSGLVQLAQFMISPNSVGWTGLSQAVARWCHPWAQLDVEHAAWLPPTLLSAVGWGSMPRFSSHSSRVPRGPS